ATSVFLRVDGREDEPCAVTLSAPRTGGDGWRVATTLPRAGARAWGFGQYEARNYDELADHPVEMGCFDQARFEAAGVPHDIVISGRHDTDFTRLKKDLAAVCEAQIRLFEPRTGRAPFERYLFLTMAVGDSYGGLEHRASTALICARNDLPHAGMTGVTDGYRTFLGLASHEYFHSWLVKRIKPAAFVRYDLDRENYTRLLWIFEGFTSYYDNLMLVRAGVISVADYLKSLADTVSHVLRGPGRLNQSVAESSFDAWTKFYRPDENSPNTVVSYYAKGALVALCLDLHIRTRSAGRRSLDDVLRLMWRRHGRTFDDRPSGLDEDAFAALALEATGVALEAELTQWAYRTGELPLGELLRTVGVEQSLKAAGDGAPSLGARLATRNGDLTIATALAGQAAMRAGMSSGDVIVAVDGLRVDERSLNALLARRKAGDRIAVHAFRRDELMQFDVRLMAGEATECGFTLDDQATDAIRRQRNHWLGQHG
ncbi:MAG TPA: PDZ domain-containing protein, partial [Burkholderiaceae bacterium]|nr:PDZ domain-containing protein [Burkholderiaceae bacterium]